MPSGVGSGEGVFPSPVVVERSEEGTVPLPRKVFHFYRAAWNADTV